MTPKTKVGAIPDKAWICKCVTCDGSGTIEIYDDIKDCGQEIPCPDCAEATSEEEGNGSDS